MDNNQNNMEQNSYYSNDSYYGNNNYSDHYNNASYTQEKKSNGLWWKLLILIILIVIIILLLLKFCGSGSGKTVDQKFTELSNKVCEAAKKHIGNNPTLMGAAEPGKSVIIKLQTLADENLIDAQIENPNYDGNLVKKGTQERYYSLSNSVRVSVAGDGSYYCELVDNSKDVTPPELRLNGDAEITMTVGTDFEDPGYTATDDFDGDITDKVVRSGNVDNSTAGTYTLIYSVQDSAGNPATKTRTIIYTEFKDASITLGSILDGVTPMIKLKGANPYCMVKGTQYIEPGAMATDNVDGNITDRIVVTNRVTGNILGTFRLVYTVEDSSGNKAIAYRAVIVSTECPDVVSEPEKEVNHAPVITLVGKNSVTINKGTEYIDLGATAYDQEDGDLTSRITTDATQVNVNSAGIYKVIYRVTDSGGKTTTKTRIVTVKDNVAGNPQVRFTEDKANITLVVGEGNNSLLTAPKAVNENGIQVNVSMKIEDYTTKTAVNAIDWNAVGKYRVIYTAIHGNGVLKQTKTIVVTIISGETTIGGKDSIEVDLRQTNCDINEADLVKGGVTFSAPGNQTPIVTLSGHENKACTVGTYIIKATATSGEGSAAIKDITVKVVDRGTTTVPQGAPSKVKITSNSATPANVYNTTGVWVGGAVTGITLGFTSTPATGTAIARFEYSKSCNTVDGTAAVTFINRSTFETGGSLTWTEEGQFVVCIRAVNTEGSAGAWSDPVKVYLDTTGPKVEFTHSWKDGVSDWHNQASLTVTYKATDNGSGLDHFEYTFDDVKAKKAENIATYNEANGSLTVKEGTEPGRTQLYVYVRAVDKVGNKGEWTLKPAYANMDTVKPEDPIITGVTGNNTATVKLNTVTIDGVSTRPSGIGKFVYTLNDGSESSVKATATRSVTERCAYGSDDLTTARCVVETRLCNNSAVQGTAGVDYTEIEDSCTRSSDYKGTITMPANKTGADINYNVKVWAVDRAGNRSTGYASKSVTVAPTKDPVTAVELYNGDKKIADKAACSTEAVTLGNNIVLRAVAVPKGADNSTAVTWTISDESVATASKSKCINMNGEICENEEVTINTLKEGTATVTATIGSIETSCVLTIKKQVITCAAGTYLPKTKDVCETCKANSYCTGGSYPVSDTADQGIESCPSGKTSSAGSTSSSACTGGSSGGSSGGSGGGSGGKCYCCGGSQGCRYTWADDGKNPTPNSCGAVSRSKANCVGTTYDEAKAKCTAKGLDYNVCSDSNKVVESRDADACVKCVAKKTSCPQGQELVNGVCKACTVKGASAYRQNTCYATSCNAGWYLSGTTCLQCPHQEGVSAWKNACIISSCKTDYRLNATSTSCVKCNKDHATAYGANCEVTKCESGYVVLNGICTKQAAQPTGKCSCVKIITVQSSGSCTCRVGSGSSYKTVAGTCSNGTCKCNNGGSVASNSCKSGSTTNDIKDGTCKITLGIAHCSCPTGYTVSSSTCGKS